MRLLNIWACLAFLVISAICYATAKDTPENRRVSSVPTWVRTCTITPDPKQNTLKGVCGDYNWTRDSVTDDVMAAIPPGTNIKCSAYKLKGFGSDLDITCKRKA